jgi:hypothetical protein
MMLAGPGLLEMVMLLLFGSGGMSNEFLSLLDARAYFASRKVEVSVSRMVELATREPANAKDQVSQLLALRWLAEEPAQVKRAKDFARILDSIEQVALGKKAQDPQGFAAEYAAFTAVKLGSTRVQQPVSRLPDNSVRQDALAWFPPSVQFVGASDLRGGPADIETGKTMREFLLKFMPPQAQEELFGVAEKLGNVRIDRFAVGYAPPSKEEKEGRIFFRITGKGDQKRLVELLKQTNPGMTTKELKGFRGPHVVLLQSQARFGMPGMAVVGNTDLLVAGVENPRDNSTQLVEQMLAVRAGKEKNVLSSPLEKLLKKTSTRATAIVAGELTNEMRFSFMHGPEAFRAFPKTLLGELLRTKDGLQARFQGTLETAAESKQFVDDVARLKKLTKEGLKKFSQNVPPGFPVPPKTFEHLDKMLDSIKAQAKGESVSVHMSVPADLFKAMINFGAGVWALGPAAGPAQPAPAVKTPVDTKTDVNKKIEEKKESRPKKGASLRLPGRALAFAVPARPELTRPRPAITCLHEYAERL